eukprot:s3412_g9.t1
MKRRQADGWFRRVKEELSVTYGESAIDAATEKRDLNATSETPPGTMLSGAPGERVCSGSTALQSVPTRSVIIAGSLAFGATAGIAWRKKFKSKKRLRLPKLPVQPSLQQVIGVLRRVDPALGNLAETVSQVWDLLQTELEERRALDGSQAEKIDQSGSLERKES